MVKESGFIRTNTSTNFLKTGVLNGLANDITLHAKMQEVNGDKRFSNKVQALGRRVILAKYGLQEGRWRTDTICCLMDADYRKTSCAGIFQWQHHLKKEMELESVITLFVNLVGAVMTASVMPFMIFSILS